jgi:hypothetical protein
MALGVAIISITLLRRSRKAVPQRSSR